MKLCAVIVAYNHLPEVMTCLNSLRAFRTDPNTTFHVQDDASPDVLYPACIPPEIATVARNPVNVGFGANANSGARFAIEQHKADVVVLINQDVQAVGGWSEGWDTALLNAFAGEQVGVVAPRLLFGNGAIQSVGGVHDQLAQPIHRCLGWTNPHAPECSTPCDVEWATGAMLAVQTTLFQHLNGFNEGYHMYFEDAEFAVRAREAGARIRFEPGATLIHNPGSTGGSPYFLDSALKYKREVVDRGRVKPGILQPVRRYW